MSTLTRFSNEKTKRKQFSKQLVVKILVEARFAVASSTTHVANAAAATTESERKTDRERKRHKAGHVALFVARKTEYVIALKRHTDH